MSTKEVKALMKEIREAIKTDNCQLAIKKCEDVLALEPESYMGHLLMGAAYQNTNKQEAAKYLRKAVDFCSPQPPTVALQGLANCAPLDELPKIYEQLIELLPEKKVDYSEKLYNIAANSAITIECYNILKNLVKTSDNDDTKAALLQLMGKLLIQKDVTITDDDDNIQKLSLEAVIQMGKTENYLVAYKRYLKLLYKLQSYSECIEHAEILISQYPEDIYAYEWICKIYCETHDTAAGGALSGIYKGTIEVYATKLAQLNPNSSLALLVNAINLYNSEQYVAAREYLYKAQAIQKNYSVTFKYLALTLMHLEAYDLALSFWENFSENRNTNYAICASYGNDQEKLAAAVDILKCAEATDEITGALARCYFKLSDARNLNRLQLNDLSKAELMYTDCPAEGLMLLSSSWVDLETFDALLVRGKLYFDVQDYSAALNCVLKATRLRPYSSQCFYYLGKIYLATNDIIRSRKCFEKCVNLNPSNRDAVEKLSGIYQQLGEESLNVALLLNSLKLVKEPTAFKHIYYKLGLHYLRAKNCDEAIQCFRTAIKHDVSCSIYWESLGDAYAERGSYNSALKVFQKILDMYPDNVYAKLQIALIKTTIRQYAEAIEDFDCLLKENIDYLPALKGAADAHVGLANNLKLEYRFGRAKDHYQKAVNMLQRCFLNPESLNMVWLWRSTANVFMLTAQMPEPLANLDVSGDLAKRDMDIAFLTRIDLLRLAVRYYTCALKIKQNSYLWYDMAFCCYYCAKHLNEEADSYLEMATKACQMAIKEDPQRWHNWNLLGVINLHDNIKNLPLAQHCFIQALQLERKSYTTWTNLGVFYLKLQEVKMANQAFQRAQQSSPIYPNAWIGQALIAEYIDEKAEALDLFRHCQQFDYHPESALGFAHWVCNLLMDREKLITPYYKHYIEGMYADVIAFDAINWHTITEASETSASAWSFLGYLSERFHQYRLAARAYSKGAEKSKGDERDRLFSNLGYVHLKLNEPNEAIAAFNKVSHSSFKTLIGLALAYAKAGHHQESYSVYTSVFESIDGVEDEKASMILVAMASMYYTFQGESDTKTILYQCILRKGFPIQALFAACALGVLHNDNQLAETILSELKKHDSSEDYVADIAYLTAQYYVVNKQPRKALSYLMSRVHIYPHCAELRQVLARFLLENYGDDVKYQIVTSQIALSAIALVHASKTKKSNSLDDSETLLLASKALRSVDLRRSQVLIQKSILLYPSNANAWKALLASN